VLQWIYFIPNCRVKSLTCVTISSSLEASCSVHWNVLDYGYTGARTDTTQQSGQTPDKEVKIKNVTVCVSGYTETDTTGMLFPPIVWPFSVAADINSNVFDLYFLIWSLSRLLCCVGSGFNVAIAKGYKHTLTICNTHCFSTTTMVTRTGLNITSYVLCLYCCICKMLIDWVMWVSTMQIRHV